MANKLSFSLQVDGAEQSAQKVKNVGNAIDALNAKVGKSGQKLGSFISGFPPHIQQSILEQLGAQRPGSVPPIISSAGRPNWTMAGLGGAAGMFSPWIGARALSSSGAFGGGGAGGGILFGQGGFGGFLNAFIVLTTVSRSLRFAFEELRDAVKRGSDLFIKAAGLGLPATQFAHIRSALTAAGLPEGTAERLLAMGQFSRGLRMSPGSLEGQAKLGAARGILSREEMQTILNMSEQVSMAWEATARAAAASAAASSELQEMAQAFASQMADIRADFEEVSALVLSFSSKFVGTIIAFKAAWEFVLDKIFSLAKLLGFVLPDKSTNNQKFGLGPGTLAGRPESGWEKMGLIIAGGVGGTDYAKQTAHNTKRIADLLQMNKAFNPETPAGPNTYNHLG